MINLSKYIDYLWVKEFFIIVRKTIKLFKNNSTMIIVNHNTSSMIIVLMIEK